MTSAFSPRHLICIHRKPQLTSPSLLRRGSFEGWLQSSSAFPGNETSVPYGVNLKERHVDGSWKGKSIWKKKNAEWKDRKIHTPFSFLVLWYPPLRNWNSTFFEQVAEHLCFQAPLFFLSSPNSGPGNAFRAQIWKQKGVYKFTLSTSCNITVFSQENFYSSLPLG